jgi:CheY-like chemotaxis protein
VSILLIEQDPFVRTDMAQALRSAFPDLAVICAERSECCRIDKTPWIVLSDHVLKEDEPYLQARRWKAAEMAFIWTDSNGRDTPPHWLCLSRPFTDAMLIRIVREALGQEVVKA